MKKEIIISALIIAIAIFGFAWFQYQFNLKTQQMKMLQEEQKKEDMTLCFELAHENYINNWNLRCRQWGYKNGCTLARIFVDDLEEDKITQEKICIERYK